MTKRCLRRRRQNLNSLKMPKTLKSAKAPAEEGGRSGLLSTGDVARLCGVTRDGVGHWIRAGKLPAFRTPGGHFRVRAEDLRHFLRRSAGHETGREGRRQSILVVDDEPAIRALLSDILAAAPYPVVTAASADEALRLALADPPLLLITDVALPDGDGTELVRNLRRRPELAGLPIIAVTGVFDSEVTSRVYAAGVDLLLAKPFRPDHLLGEVRRLLSAGAEVMEEARP